MQKEKSAELIELQNKIDVDKWLASERAGKDLCGAADYCPLCDKGEHTPCARAALRAESCAASEAEGAPVPEGFRVEIRYRRSFKAKLIQNEKLQDFYTQLKNHILGFSSVKSRLCFRCETFRVGRAAFAKFAVSGKTLCLYLALSPAAFEGGKYRFENVSSVKSHARTPMKLKITSARAASRAKELVEKLADKLSLANVGNFFTDYRCAPLSDEKLIEKGLVKPYKTLVRAKR